MKFIKINKSCKLFSLGIQSSLDWKCEYFIKFTNLMHNFYKYM
jgi:hypothetical protein